MELTQIDQAVRTRAAVRISKTHGWAAGRTGIAMGYTTSYDSIKVGFLGEDGKYSGDFTKVPRSAVELVTTERHRDNRPDNDAMFIPDMVAPEGTVWVFWKGSIYRNGKGSALPASLLRAQGATETDFGEWI